MIGGVHLAAVAGEAGRSSSCRGRARRGLLAGPARPRAGAGAGTDVVLGYVGEVGQQARAGLGWLLQLDFFPFFYFYFYFHTTPMHVYMCCQHIYILVGSTRGHLGS